MYGEAETARSRYLEVAQGCTARDLDGNTVAGPPGSEGERRWRGGREPE